jgi:hypothetical protein
MATIVDRIFVMLAGATRRNPSFSYIRLPEPSSRIATVRAVTDGAGSVPPKRGPPGESAGLNGTVGALMRMLAAVSGSGSRLGGAATSQYCCCATCVAVSVAAGLGVGVTVGVDVLVAVAGGEGVGVLVVVCCGDGAGVAVGVGVARSVAVGRTSSGEGEGPAAGGVAWQPSSSDSAAASRASRRGLHILTSIVP